MKNFLTIFFFVLALGLLCIWGLPWWAIVPIGLLAGWFFKPSFGAGFLAGFLLWGVPALVLDRGNDGILSARVGQLFQGLGSWTLILITGLIGGILASLSVLVARYGRDWAFPPKKGYYERRRKRR